jgi:hypothetical protein
LRFLPSYNSAAPDERRVEEAAHSFVRDDEIRRLDIPVYNLLPMGS